MKDHLKLHLLHIYHIVIRSELKYLIGVKVLSLRKCGTGQKTAGSVGFGGVRFFDGVKPVATVSVRFQPGPGTEPPIWNRC